MSDTDGLSKIVNRPGLSALNYRVGDYSAFRSYLLAQLSQIFPHLKTRDADDPAIALLDSWAVVADVLTFYQERLANEGYLNTATERQSIIELARLIGYELKPGVSASTHLAFTLEDKPDGSPWITISKGTQVMSIPGEGELPQIFETSEELQAAPVWNALKPRLAKPQDITRNTRQLYVQGVNVQLAAGDWLLLTGTADREEKVFLLALKTVESQPALETTLITWDYDLQGLDASTILHNPQLFAFRQQAGLFGNHAPRWETTPDELKRKSPGVQLKGGIFVAPQALPSDLDSFHWDSRSGGLPNQDILCLAASQMSCFAGTEGSGIFRLSKTDTSWQPINQGLTNLNVQTLYAMDEGQGHLLAGTLGGGVFRSKDYGETWSPIGVGSIRLIKDGSNNTIVDTVNTGIPNVVVRSLLSYPINQTIRFIFAGTDDGIYRTTNQGQDWSSSRIPAGSIDSFNYDRIDGLPNKTVYALLCIPQEPESITGKIKSIDNSDKNQSKITIEGITKTLKKGDVITVEGQVRQITGVTEAKIKLNEAFGPDVSNGTTFVASNMTGIINTINPQKIQISQTGHMLRKGDQITAAGQTKEIADVSNISISATLILDSAFQPELLPETDFTSLGITGKIHITHGETIEISHATGLLQRGAQLIAAGQIKTIIDVIEYNATATVKLQENFQPTVKESTPFTTQFNSTTQATGTIKEISGTQITTNATTEPLKVGHNFVANQQTKTIIDIEECTLILDRELENVAGKTFITSSIRIFSGTDQGAYYSVDHGNTWTLIDKDLDKQLIFYCLAVYTAKNQSYLLGGTNTGIWYCAVDQSTLKWEQAGELPKNDPDDSSKPNDLSSKAIRALYVIDNQIIAATDDKVFQGKVTNDSVSQGTVTKTSWTWKRAGNNPIVKNITSVAVANSQIFAGARFSGFTEVQSPEQGTTVSDQIVAGDPKEWPNFYIQPDQIDLDTLYPKILPGSWVVLLNQSHEAHKSQVLPLYLPIKVEQVSSEQRQGFTLDTKVTRLFHSQNIQNFKDFNPRSTVVLAQSELLNLAAISLTVPVQQAQIFQDPIWDNKIFLNQYVYGLNAKKTVIVSGKQIRARVNVGGVLRSRNWLLTSTNLTDDNIQSLRCREADGVLFGIAKTSIHTSSDGGKTWDPFANAPPTNTLENPEITSLVIDTQTGQGTIQAKDRDAWAKSASDIKKGDHITIQRRNRIQTRVVEEINSEPNRKKIRVTNPFEQDISWDANYKISRIFIVSNSNVFKFNSINQTWEKLPDLNSVRTLAIHPENHNLLAATDKSIFQLDQNNKWQPFDSPLHPVEALVGYKAEKTYLFAVTANGELLWTENNGAKWNPISERAFRINKVVHLAINPKNGYLFIATDKHKVFRSRDRGDSWEGISAGLENQEIQDLAFYSGEETLFALTKQGIYRSTNNGENWKNLQWENINHWTIRAGVEAIASCSSNHSSNHSSDHFSVLLAGSKAGVFRSSNQGESWESVNQGLKNLEVQALLTVSSTQLNTQDSDSKKSFDFKVFAGTREGLFVSTNYGNTWEEAKLNLIRPNVQALTSYNHQLFAAIAKQGIFHSSDGGASWVPIGFTKQDVQVLYCSGDNQNPTSEWDMLVGTAGNGIFQLRLQLQNNKIIYTSQHWEKQRSGHGFISSNGITVTGSNFLANLKSGDKIEASGQVRAVVKVISDQQLTVDVAFKPALKLTNFLIHTGLNNLYITDLVKTKSTIFVGTAGSGVFQTDDGGQHWKEINEGLEDLEIRCFQVDPTTQRLYAGTATGGVLWLNTEYDLILMSADQTEDLPIQGKGLIVVAKIKNCYYHARIFDRAGNRVVDKGENQFSPDQKLVQQLEKEITSLSIDSQTKSELVKEITDNLNYPIPWGWEAVNTGLTNTDVRDILIEAGNFYIGGIGILSSLDDSNFVELQPDDLLRVVTAPTDAHRATDLPTIAPQDPVNSQIKEWQVLNRDNFKGKLLLTRTQDIRLEPADDNDPTVSEMAVIQAPPTDEDRPVLLLEKPLANSYDPATVKVYANVVEATHGETVSEILGSGNGAAINQRFVLSKPPLTHLADPSAKGSKSELKVYVNDVRWTEVSSLYSLDKQDRSYILQIEDDGTTTITFGDGQRGSRLPSGRENITTTYRSGIGLAGNIGAERISLKKTGPPSVQSVINPVPSTGGAPGESLESARMTIPATTRTLNRIVSRRDFQDFTQGFAGIGKAEAIVLWNGTSELIHITIAGINGERVETESALYRSLVVAIDAARDPIQQVQITSFTRLNFKLEAKVMYQNNYQADKVKPEIQQKLLKTFAFEQRSFGQPVTQSEIIAAIQSVPGVMAVDIDFLHRQDASRTLQSSLAAAHAVWDAQTNQVKPAQLLMLLSSGIKLTDWTQPTVGLTL